MECYRDYLFNYANSSNFSSVLTTYEFSGSGFTRYDNSEDHFIKFKASLIFSLKRFVLNCAKPHQKLPSHKKTLVYSGKVSQEFPFLLRQCKSFEFSQIQKIFNCQLF